MSLTPSLCSHLTQPLFLVIFVAGTRFYTIVKPKKEAARLYLHVPVVIVVSIVPPCVRLALLATPSAVGVACETRYLRAGIIGGYKF